MDEIFYYRCPKCNSRAVKVDHPKHTKAECSKCGHKWELESFDRPRGEVGRVDHCFNRIDSELRQIEEYIHQLEIEHWAFRLLHKACYEKGYRPDASDRTNNPICTALAVVEARLRQEGTLLTPLEALEKIGKLPGVQDALKDEGEE